MQAVEEQEEPVAIVVVMKEDCVPAAAKFDERRISGGQQEQGISLVVGSARSVRPTDRPTAKGDAADDEMDEAERPIDEGTLAALPRLGEDEDAAASVASAAAAESDAVE